jgi:hypothetical protein
MVEFRRRPANEVVKAIIRNRTPEATFDGNGWYRDLTALHELRNHVVHYYPEKMETGTFPDRLAPHVGAKATFKPVGDETMDWTSRLIVKSVALKAVKVAAAATKAFDVAVKGW